MYITMKEKKKLSLRKSAMMLNLRQVAAAIAEHGNEDPISDRYSTAVSLYNLKWVADYVLAEGMSFEDEDRVEQDEFRQFDELIDRLVDSLGPAIARDRFGNRRKFKVVEFEGRSGPDPTGRDAAREVATDAAYDNKITQTQ